MIYRFELAQVEGTSNVLLNNCKQNITSLSLLAGTTVQVLPAKSDSDVIFCLQSWIGFWQASIQAMNDILVLHALNLSPPPLLGGWSVLPCSLKIMH